MAARTTTPRIALDGIRFVAVILGALMFWAGLAKSVSLTDLEAYIANSLSLSGPWAARVAISVVALELYTGASLLLGDRVQRKIGAVICGLLLIIYCFFLVSYSKEPCVCFGMGVAKVLSVLNSYPLTRNLLMLAGCLIYLMVEPKTQAEDIGA